MGDEPTGDLDDCHLGHRKSEPEAEPGGQELSGEQAGMSGIVLEFDHVQVAIGAAHEMGLRAAPQLADVLNRAKWGGSQLRKTKVNGLRGKERPFKVKSSHVVPASNRLILVRASLSVLALGVARCYGFDFFFCCFFFPCFCFFCRQVFLPLAIFGRSSRRCSMSDSLHECNFMRPICTILGIGTFPALMYRLSAASVIPSFLAASRVE